jgi:hypothetical protein
MHQENEEHHSHKLESNMKSNLNYSALVSLGSGLEAYCIETISI